MQAVSLMGGVIQGTALSLSTVVTTLAGTARDSSGFIDATTGTNAKFNAPTWAMTTDGTNLYVADYQADTYDSQGRNFYWGGNDP